MMLYNTVCSYPFDTMLHLVPPSLSTGTEVFFSPWGEKDLAIFGNITVGKSKRKRSRSTNNRSGWRILGSVAWADELVVGSRPWNNATQVCADWSRRGGKSNVRKAAQKISCNMSRKDPSPPYQH